MFSYSFTYIHTYIHIYTYSHIYIYTYIHIYIYTYIHIHIYTYIHIYIYTYIHIYIYTYTHIYIYTYTYLHIYIYTYIITYIYVCIYILSFYWLVFYIVLHYVYMYVFIYYCSLICFVFFVIHHYYWIYHFPGRKDILTFFGIYSGSPYLACSACSARLRWPTIMSTSRAGLDTLLIGRAFGRPTLPWRPRIWAAWDTTDFLPPTSPNQFRSKHTQQKAWHSNTTAATTLPGTILPSTSVWSHLSIPRSWCLALPRSCLMMLQWGVMSNSQMIKMGLSSAMTLGVAWTGMGFLFTCMFLRWQVVFSMQIVGVHHPFATCITRAHPWF